MEIRPILLGDLKTGVPLPYDLVGADGRTVFRAAEIPRKYEVLLLRSLGVERLYRSDSDVESEAVRVECNVSDVHPSEISPGEPLARSVHGRTGAMLLRKGAKLTHEYLLRLAQLEIRSVCVHRGHRPRPESEQFKIARKRLGARLGDTEHRVSDLAPWETECFVQTWLDVSQRYAKMKVKATQAELSMGLSTRADFLWMVQLWGDPDRVLLFSIPRDYCVAAAGSALQIKDVRVDDQAIVDVLSLLIAIFIADAETMMAKAGSQVSFGPPQLISGSEVSACAPESVRFLVLPFRARAGWMRIALTIDALWRSDSGADGEEEEENLEAAARADGAQLSDAVAGDASSSAA